MIHALGIPAIWIFCFLIVVFAPMRWSLIAYLCLSVVDFEGGRGSFAVFNVLRGILLPAYLLWKLRRFSGHASLPIAPVAWLLLTCYVAIAGTWSLFPESAHKLVVQMFGSFMIVCVFTRASKGGFLTAQSAVWTAAGCLLFGFMRSLFYPEVGDSPGRFTAFTSAQAYAALLAALYCIVLCGRGLTTTVRVVTCSAIAMAIVWDGSRIWFIGILLGTLLSLLLSRGQVWLKICALSLIFCLVVILTGDSDYLFRYVAAESGNNRIASAITALHQGDRQAVGLGTFNFRRAINDEAIRQIKSFSGRELIFGRGTCNGAVITAVLSAGYATVPDPNRMFHNEWLRVIYEWGLIGSFFWLSLFASVIGFVVKGVMIDPTGDAKPLLIYLPAFMFGLGGENFIAGAGQAANIGFIFAIALSTAPHRDFLAWRLRRAVSRGKHRYVPTRDGGDLPTWKGQRRRSPASAG